jgi:YD repeat-containing protein
VRGKSNTARKAEKLKRFCTLAEKTRNRTKSEEGGSNVVDWSYYYTYRLKNEKRSGTGAFNTTHTCDAVGNRMVQQNDGALTTYTYDAASQLTTSKDSTGTTTYSYDQAGNQQVVQTPANARTTYSWDDENRNKRLQLSSGAVTTMSYRFDGLRYQKVGTTTTKFIYDEQNYFLETDASNVVNKVITNEPRGYGNLNSQRILLGGSTWTPVYHHFDALGSTRQVTNSSGVLSNSYTYNAWGDSVAVLEAITNLFRWVGELGYYFDSEHLTYYVRSRP